MNNYWSLTILSFNKLMYYNYNRYEMDTLKLYCEQELAIRHLDENSVIFLLSMADRFNARSLRVIFKKFCLCYKWKLCMWECCELMQIEFFRLPQWNTLQLTLKSWRKNFLKNSVLSYKWKFTTLRCGLGQGKNSLWIIKKQPVYNE